MKTFTPYCTYLLVFICLLVYFLGGHPVASLEHIWRHPWQLISYQFGHADIAHIGGNMLFLMLLGPLCEKRLGFKRFIGLYLVAGVAGALIFRILYPQGQLIGASASVSGLMAIFPLMQINRISKLLNGLFLGFIFYTNFLNLMISSILGLPPTVAFLAHLGGGLAALILYSSMLSKSYHIN